MREPHAAPQCPFLSHLPAIKSLLSPSLYFQCFSPACQNEFYFLTCLGRVSGGIGNLGREQQGKLCLHTFHLSMLGWEWMLGTALPGILPAVTAARIHPVFPPVSLVLPQNPRCGYPEALALKWDVRRSFASATCWNEMFSPLGSYGCVWRAFQVKNNLVIICIPDRSKLTSKRAE